MELTQTKQCANCSWKVDRDLNEILCYNRENHENLNQTIANPDGDVSQLKTPLRIMACHYSSDEKLLPCIGWIYNQVRNNNLALRLALVPSSNVKHIEIDGEQRTDFTQTFDD
jgi:hypothetical protein